MVAWRPEMNITSFVLPRGLDTQPAPWAIDGEATVVSADTIPPQPNLAKFVRVGLCILPETMEGGASAKLPFDPKQVTTPATIDGFDPDKHTVLTKADVATGIF